jgi:proteasome lid subunit RPN8/RPN11
MNLTLGSVCRLKPLPVGALRGTFLFTERVFDFTRDALVSFALAGIHDRGHEGLVYWAGRELGDVTVFTSVIVPKAEHSAQRVFVPKEAVGAAARAARQSHVGILCQVHSHPGFDTRHSDGDDEMILLPFEGMLSIVAPEYGVSLGDVSELAVHQYQERRWVQCSRESVSGNFHKVPSVIDLR